MSKLMQWIQDTFGREDTFDSYFVESDLRDQFDLRPHEAEAHHFGDAAARHQARYGHDGTRSAHGDMSREAPLGKQVR